MARPPAPGFACSECGWTGAKWFGRCPECQAWGSVIERGAPTTHVAPASVSEARAAKPITAHLAEDAWLYVESDAAQQPEPGIGWQLHRQGSTHEVRFALYRRQRAATLATDSTP